MEFMYQNILGSLGFPGATVNAAGEILLLASKATIEGYPKLKPFAKLLSNAERMAVPSPIRTTRGTLIGAFITSLTATIARLLVKRSPPQLLRDWTEGAGFNIAYMIFFARTTISFWK